MAWARLALLAVAGIAAFVAGAAVGAPGDDPRRARAQAFADAWARGDHRAMYRQVSPGVRATTSLKRFSNAYRRSATTATLDSVKVAGPIAQPRGKAAVAVPIMARTRIFGAQRATISVPVVRGADDRAWVDWNTSLTYPGLRRGERLKRSTRMPPRAAIQARDGTIIARGEERTTELDSLSADIAGRLGEAPQEQLAELERRGVPAGTPVGLTGLEREFQARIAGTPGGELTAGDRVLAEVAPRAASAVRSTIDPEIQNAAVKALAGRVGGIAVIRPSSGEVLALAGVAYSAPQPPGSVFKIITLAGGLESGVAKPSDDFPVVSFTTIEGVELENSDGDMCGGSLANSFAHSCNSVFAPMGAKLGAKRLVKEAERFGFNAEPSLVGAAPSTLPPAAELGDDLAIGSTAIGQGRVLATPLLFATIGATIAEGGERVEPTLLKAGETERTRVIKPAVAKEIAAYMRKVVTDGSGQAAAIDGVKVAGKTGTAELRNTVPEEDDPDVASVEDDTTDTNAWFVAYAPYKRPKVAVAVMLIGQGTGGKTAAPTAKLVLKAALDR